MCEPGTRAADTAPDPLDRMLKLAALKARVASEQYVVDPGAVAEALLSAADARVILPLPPARAPDHPSPVLEPGRADRRSACPEPEPRGALGDRDRPRSSPWAAATVAGSRRTARSPRRRRRRLARRDAELRRHSATPARAAGVEVDVEPHAAAPGDVRASVASPSERSMTRRRRARQRAALGQPGLGAQVAPTSASGPLARPSRTARPAADAPSVPVTPTASPGRAPSRPTRSSRLSAQPTTVTATSARGRARSPPATDVAGPRGERLHARDESRTASAPARRARPARRTPRRRRRPWRRGPTARPRARGGRRRRA